jgi:hypothetical protein
VCSLRVFYVDVVATYWERLRSGSASASFSWAAVSRHRTKTSTSGPTRVLRGLLPQTYNPPTPPYRKLSHLMNAIERVEQRALWLTQLAHGASSALGLGKAVMAISTMARKRDLSAIWELDPVAAPPRKVQRQLMGTIEGDEQPARGEARDDAEQRSVLELQLQHAMRQHDVERVRTISRELRVLAEAAQQEAARLARARGELRVGDECFALAKIVEWEWYRARLVHVRAREPQLQVEYMATLHGEGSRLALPMPRVNHLPIQHVRISKPEPCDGPIVPPTTACVVVPALRGMAARQL